MKNNARLEARVDPKLKNLFIKVAKMQGINLTNFIVLSAKKEADTVLKQQSLIKLSLRDTNLLFDEGGQNKKPSASLKLAADKFKASLK